MTVNRIDGISEYHGDLWEGHGMYSSIKTVQRLGINLTQHVQDLCFANIKTQLSVIMDDLIMAGCGKRQGRRK